MEIGSGEYGALAAVVVKHVRDAFVDEQTIAAQWKRLNYTAPPDLPRAIEQHDRFIDILRSAGAVVHQLPRDSQTTLDSIYVRSKENIDATPTPQKPWLGVPHFAALIVASVALAIANSLLRGRGIENIPAVDVVIESGVLMLVTAFVCAVPATGYWIARKAWMPELTRFAWLAWIVVGFAFTYGNYLTSLAKT